jgi:Domain of unknown function (DUF2017)
MTDGFERRRGGRVVATFSGFEADLLRSLAAQLVELLRDGTTGPSTAEDPLEQLVDIGVPTTAPDDPVLARLFPTAYPDDEEAAGDFRRFTEGSLRESKAGAAMAVIDALEEAGLPGDLGEERIVVDVELDGEAAVTWLRSFTDIRLALATRLGVEQDDEDYWADLPAEDPRVHVYEIYQWLGFLQETLVEAVGRPRR